MDVEFEIAEIWRYPVKSMAGERVDQAALRQGGIDGDRRFALRSHSTGKIVSAKQPRPYGQLLAWSASTVDDRAVVVESPDGVRLEVGDGELDSQLSEALGEPVSVVEVVEGVAEAYDSHWPEIPGTSLSDMDVELPIAMMTEKVSFVDLAALHIIVADSLEHLRTLVDGATVGVERFRPNIVLGSASGVAGFEGFADLSWNDCDARVGSVELRVTNASPRCVMTTLAQGRYESAKGVLQTLAAHAKTDLDGVGTFACFGTYAEIVSGGSVKVGDRLVLGD